MARFPGAVFAGTPNQSGPMGLVMGVTLHITVGRMPGVLSWLRNPASGASSHIINPRKGKMIQLVDTGLKAWAQGAGNPSWISVENEGMPPENLTESQIQNLAEFMAWMNKTHGTPLQLTDSPSHRGLGWHGMGGKAWGNHPNCPGEPIKAQRGEILRRAARLLAPAVITGAAAPIRPPTRTIELGSFQEEDMTIKTADILDIPLDEAGNGWTKLAGGAVPRVPWENLLGVTMAGPAPERDGYAWPNIYMAVNNTDGFPVIEFEGGAPHGVVGVHVSYIEA